MNQFVVLAQIALRNLFASFFNLIIGGIILVGTFFFVVGSSLISNIDSAMSRSITGSVSGHAQVYSSKSKDELSIFNNMGIPDLAVIPDFSKVKNSLSQVENVKAVIPMGINNAFVAYGNTVDQALEKLRSVVNRRLKHDPAPDLGVKYESLKQHVRHMVDVIQSGYKNYAAISSAAGADPREIEALRRAGSDAFWASFDKDPLNNLEFLENNIAALVPDADFAFFSYAGTDLDSFTKTFDRLKIADGTSVPPGQRGLLLSKYVYERQFKLKIARRLDEINEAITEKGKKIATDPDIQLLIKQNRAQTREIILQLDPANAKVAQGLLQKHLGTEEKDLAKLLTAFLDTTDENFAVRYKYFYESIAPLVELYRLRPGDVLTIKAYTKSGYIQSANIKVYGTFEFEGLEKSGIAGSISLMDLMSFRDLYGFLTTEKVAEMAAITKAVGAKKVDRDNVEAELFGGSSVVHQASNVKINENAELGLVAKGGKKTATEAKPFTPEELENGIALNAAIILKDPSKLDQTMKKIDEVSQRDGLDLKVISWQKAAGMIGQFVLLAKIVLYLAIFIIFTVALVIINNAVMMATLQRVREIGTMRAIGAQRSFVLAMVLVETMVLGAVFGSIGAALGSGVVKFIGVKGIPAANEFLYFFFAGPRLYTTLSGGSIVGAFAIVLLVTVISALYPAIIATRVSPLQAMQSEE